MIRLDGLASQTGFQRAVSPKCNVLLFIVSMLHMLLSGGWLLLENGYLYGDQNFTSLPLVYCSHTFVRTYVVISQCPHPGVNDACHMGEGGMWSLAPRLKCSCNSKLRSTQRIMGCVSVSLSVQHYLDILFTAFGIAYSFLYVHYMYVQYVWHCLSTCVCAHQFAISILFAAFCHCQLLNLWTISLNNHRSYVHCMYVRWYVCMYVPNSNPKQHFTSITNLSCNVGMKVIRHAGVDSRMNTAVCLTKPVMGETLH